MKATTTTISPIDKMMLLRIASVVIMLLSIPLLAMQFTSEVNWKAGDFIAAGVLLTGIGLAFELIFGKRRGGVVRTVSGTVLAAAMLLVWAELAVGIFD